MPNLKISELVAAAAPAATAEVPVVSGASNFRVTLSNLVKSAITAASATPSSIGLSAVAVTGSYDDLSSKPSLAVTLTGNVTGTGTGTITTTIPAGTVTNVMQANMAFGTVKARLTAGAGRPEDVTLANFKIGLALTLSDITQSSATTGQVPQWSGTAWVAATPAVNYTLPNATTSTLGGVIVGAGLAVTSGTVSANVTSVAGRTGAVTIAAGDVSGLGSLATQSSVAYSSLTGTPSTFTPAAHNQAWSTITSTPTTLSGYGITDAVGSSDARLTDSRTPLAHNQAWSTITSTPTTLAGYAISDAVGSSDSRLTDSRTPTSHVHGNITNAGAIGSTSGQIVVTTTSGVLTTAATISSAAVTGLPTAGTGSSNYCAGNDSRLSDARTPVAHTHDLSSLNQSSATTGQVPQWSGTAWVATTPSGGGGGSTNASDLTSGTLADERLSSKARAAVNVYLWSAFR